MKYCYIKKLEKHADVEDYFIVKSKPSWFNNLCPFKNKRKNIIDAYKDLTNKWDLIYKTLKICPGINDLFKTQLL